MNNTNNKNNNKTNFIKSKNGISCITPCYPANVWSLNPITFRYHTATVPYCHISHNNLNSREIDECNNPINMEEYKKINIDILYPNYELDYEYFLSYYYNLHSEQEILDYLKNNNLSIYTRSRLVNSYLVIYGKNITIVDNQIINFFIELVKTKWISDIYKKIYKYIFINKNIVIITEIKNNNLKYHEYKTERINFIINNFITNDDINKLLYNYIDTNKNNWDNIEDQLQNIKKYLINNIENKIEQIINNSK